MSYLAVDLAGADTPGEHLRLAAFTAVVAAVALWMGRRQRRTGRTLTADAFGRTRLTQRLGGGAPGGSGREPAPPTRTRRVLGCAWMLFGGIFLLPAVFNTAAAVRELLG
ncbi:MAG: hypothetical protein JF597_31785 [Streptomyces sp.]|uniref:hypothetical protein n=1 Tax=Streptomyces sp. TaxID=1931 RepID=UPI0025CBD490|nr:hypothetical protein [Streptomyces sp.]MBW8798001.1 hypothetical protein [Streptomyces sp.]